MSSAKTSVTLMDFMNILSERKSVVKFESPTNFGGCTILKSVNPIGSDITTGIIVNMIAGFVLLYIAPKLTFAALLRFYRHSSHSFLFNL